MVRRQPPRRVYFQGNLYVLWDVERRSVVLQGTSGFSGIKQIRDGDWD